jgi:leucyl aminopeptidase
MPPRLPLDALTVPVRALRARVSPAVLRAYPAAILLLPRAPTPAEWSALPHGAMLRALHERHARKAGDLFCLRVGELAETVLVVGYVDARAGTFEQLQFAAKLAKAALECAPKKLLLWSHGKPSATLAGAMLSVIAGIQAAAFRLASFKSKPKVVKSLTGIDVGAKLDGLEVGLATSAGNNLARWLTALPPNELDARSYRRYLQEFARHWGLKYTFYGEAQLTRLGAGAFLAVARGNEQPGAGIVYLSHRPRGATRAHAALVGKGICFDTGGTNLKTHKGMLDMHMDMEGSAVALGSLHALLQLGSPLALDCWLAITENRIGPRAYKPQDLIKALNGTTIQVIHTDAEGRMVLADTLALAARKKPHLIIDYATLTGACVVALTERYSGAFTNRLATRAQIEAAGTRSGERVWCFPLDADFDTDIESSLADVLQCAADGKGDHILAARFLSRFVPKEIPWLHIDLSAGMRHGGLGHITTDATGFGVRYTIDLLRNGWPAGKRA